jgi:predicted O-methyltransferase YrrM
VTERPRSRAAGGPEPPRPVRYDPELLPNLKLADLEPNEQPEPGATTDAAHPGIGFPAWNLLYYALLCGLEPALERPVVVETGTGFGASTIALAQALADRGGEGVVETVDADAAAVARARANVEAAGLSDRVRFHVGDSLDFLAELAARVGRVDFAYLDDSHDREHLPAELEQLATTISPERGKVYATGSELATVAEALSDFRAAHGGGLVRFPNCAPHAPGNAIWQTVDGRRLEDAPKKLPPGRRFQYERRLLPNHRLAALEPETARWRQVMDQSGLSIGYPAWNLLYYVLLCGLSPARESPVVVETGTNFGASTIVMAQALEDLGVGTVLETVERNPEAVEKARANVEAAGLTDRVRFHVGDSLEFLRDIAERVGRIDFIFLDDMHIVTHVIAELDIVVPMIEPVDGKIYFDNTELKGVAVALAELRRKFGGNLVQFPNCSWNPPGNAVWQPAPGGRGSPGPPG